MSLFQFLLGVVVVGLVSPASAGLGVGDKFQIVPGGKAFDRFITIWLENQVCFPRSPSPIPSSTFLCIAATHQLAYHQLLSQPTGLRQGHPRPVYHRPQARGHPAHQILRAHAPFATKLHRRHRGRLLRPRPRRPRAHPRERLNCGRPAGHPGHLVRRLL